MAVLDDMDAKLDQLLSVMGEEINEHPDTMWPSANPVWQQLPLTTNMSLTLKVRWTVEDREGGRYLCMQLHSPAGYVLLNRAWRCVYRPYPGSGDRVVDRPGMDERFR